MKPFDRWEGLWWAVVVPVLALECFGATTTQSMPPQHDRNRNGIEDGLADPIVYDGRGMVFVHQSLVKNQEATEYYLAPSGSALVLCHRISRDWFLGQVTPTPS